MQRSISEPSLPGAAASARGARYDGLSIALHWASAGLILLNWLLGEFRFLAPHGAPRVSVLSTHILIGLTIALMLLARLTWRAGPGRRFRAEPGLAGALAKAAHAGLYLLIGLTVVAGMSHVAAHGLHLFGATLSAGFDRGPLHVLGGLHGTIADVLGLLAAAHALAAALHHFAFRDDVLLRMAPFLPDRGRRTGDEERCAGKPSGLSRSW